MTFSARPSLGTGATDPGLSPFFAIHGQTISQPETMRTDGNIIHRARKEVLTMSRFALVGIVATSVHVSIVWALIELFRIETLLANLVAFLTAFIVSFTGQYLWTFRSNRNWRSALARFFPVSSFGFVLNNIVLITLLELGFMSDSHAAMISACIIPIVTYLAGRFWAFK